MSVFSLVLNMVLKEEVGQQKSFLLALFALGEGRGGPEVTHSCAFSHKRARTRAQTHAVPLCKHRAGLWKDSHVCTLCR